jgi:hypothetical protein
METIAIDLDQKIAEMTNKLKKEFFVLAAHSKEYVKRNPKTDKLDDLQQKLYEACMLLHIMADVLIGHGRKAIDNFENEYYYEPNKDRYIEKLQETAIKEIPCMVKDAMMKSMD